MLCDDDEELHCLLRGNQDNCLGIPDLIHFLRLLLPKPEYSHERRDT